MEIILWDILMFYCKLTPDSFKLGLLDSFGNSKAFQLEELSCKKVLKFVLLGNCYFDLFAEVEFWY